MLIDWFTVLAQAVNFLLLVWLLKRFLYGPIRKAMKEREQRIAKDLDEAEQAHQEAEQSREALQHEREHLDEERRQVLEEARQEARQWREQAMEKARAEVDEQRRQWREAMQDEQEAFERRLTSRIADAALTVCRKALRDLADAELEVRLAEKMLRQLPQNGHKPSGRVLVRTGFPPGEELKDRLRQGLRERWPEIEDIDFQQVDSLGFGIECMLGEDKVAWNAGRYMSGLEERVLHAFARGAQPTREKPERDADGS